MYCKAASQYCTGHATAGESRPVYASLIDFETSLVRKVWTRHMLATCQLSPLPYLFSANFIVQGIAEIEAMCCLISLPH